MQSLQGRACFADAQQLCAADLCDLDALEPVEWVSLPRVLDPKGQVVDGVGQVDRDVPERLQVVHMKRGLLEVAAHPKVEVPRDLLHLDRTCESQQPNGGGRSSQAVCSQSARPPCARLPCPCGVRCFASSPAGASSLVSGTLR